MVPYPLKGKDNQAEMTRSWFLTRWRQIILISETISLASHLNDATVVSVCFYLCRDDVRRPVCQPVVDRNHESVFEELRQEEQGEQEHPGGGQVGSTGAPGDGGALTHYLGQVVFFIAFQRFL